MDNNLRYFGKDGFQWNKHFRKEVKPGKIPDNQTSGCTYSECKTIKSVLETWKLLFPPETLQKIVNYTSI